jgi:hypothetical protein
MTNKIWSFFKKLGHYIALGTADINKFVEAAQQSGVFSLLPGGALINSGIGVFEKIVAGNNSVEQIDATLGDAGLTSQQKLAAAVPNALLALNQYATAIGMKITPGQESKLQAISSGITSFVADYLNILQPINGDKLPVPNVPVPTPASPIK